MKILLFGGSGQLGFEVEKRASDLNFELLSPVISELDVTNVEQVRYLVGQVKPNLLINCAAYTAVDKAESEQEEAFKINRDGAACVAYAAKQNNIRLIHISTDYVFKGDLGRALSETDETGPLNVYGQSKLAGENEVTRILGKQGLVVRTSSLHGQRGVNFVHTMLKLFAEEKVVKVVNDQFMTVTWAGWLAEVLLDLARTECSGVLHAACSGILTWYDFAERILGSVQHKLPNAKNVRLEAISARDLARPAQRPLYSALDCSLLTKLLGRKPMSWEQGLKSHLNEIGFEEHP